MLVTWLVAAGWARDVVWLSRPAEGDVALVAAQSGVDQPDLPLVALRASRTARSEADVAAWQGLSASLEEARRYETQLDGEVLILELLEGALRDVSLVPDAVSRSQLFAVLAYQGFAANRLYGATLAEDPGAARWRTERAGVVVERPWALAWALEPDRELTAYEVAEAPQRLAYGERRAVFAESLDGIVVLPELAPEDVVFVDGRPIEQAAAGQLTVPPGNHWIHVERQGRVIERYVAEVEPGGRVDLQASIPPGTLATFAEELDEGVVVPAAVQRLLSAMGDVWLARPRVDHIALFDVSNGRAELRIVDRPSAASSATGWQASVGVLGGWFASDDFYLQDPSVEPTFGVVNAISLGAYAQAGAEVGPVWLGGGVDVLVPVGEGKVAVTGRTGVRPRLVPHAAVGLPWLHATAGVLFPHHLAVGARLQRPVGDRLEVRLSGWYGAAPAREREDDVWRGEPVFTVSGGLGWRFGD